MAPFLLEKKCRSSNLVRFGGAVMFRTAGAIAPRKRLFELCHHRQKKCLDVKLE
ncbi:hypothetical protein [Okeania sp.]|uniref:hypothetical protein n=1 Tax=Okeania sp. TaxID=3100323 RepID=UPI002B4B7A28|nr:hypothetical protein [Okeania sp.]MEB3339279.1 hypothetical protein [Okeania sp.]